MNPLLSRLHPYPFTRLHKLFRDVTPNTQLRAINLGIGEPKHATPDLIVRAYAQALDTGLSSYPATIGDASFRAACAHWIQSRYEVKLDPASQILPVLGSREALFSLAQVVVDASKPGATVVCPNPFYQIYEGAALLAGAQPHYVASDPERNFAPRWDLVQSATWAKTQLVYVCSPGNPTGAVMPLEQWEELFNLSARHGFVIASDECYSEIYFSDDSAPLGCLQAAMKIDRYGRGHLFKNLIMLTSLSKRSSVPGMRSGFVAGDADLISAFLLYRTYHGSAMSPAVQQASIAAWSDEAHVVENRRLYREKFASVTPMLADVMDVRLPDAGFYLWAGVPNAWHGSDTDFARQLYQQCNVTVLPGSYLAREVGGFNPGSGRVRMALVAQTQECVEAAGRIVQFIKSNS